MTVRHFQTVEHARPGEEDAIGRLVAVIAGRHGPGVWRERRWLDRLERWHYVDCQGGPEFVGKHPDLSQWVRNQRRSRALNALQVALLSAFDGWDWEPRDASWARRFEEVERFHSAHRRAPRTRADDVNERALALWLARQRRSMQRGQMSHLRVLRVRRSVSAVEQLFVTNPSTSERER